MSTTSLEVQQRWAALPIRQRLQVLAKARDLVACNATRLLAEGTFSNKTPSEALTAEVLPLLAAIRFLERSAQDILRPRILGGKGLPFWLKGIHSEVHRVPFGRILVIGPSNYPLLLPGIQAVQAIVAGNAVVWKPGTGGARVAKAFAGFLQDAGLPAGLLAVTDESVAEAERAIAQGVGKVFLTGSVPTGKALLHRLADSLVPSVVELSGCDVVIVLPGADLDRIVHALTFGIRLNGSCTCMAPRRILLVGADRDRKASFTQKLLEALRSIAAVDLPAAVAERLTGLLQQAQQQGAKIHADLQAEAVRPILVADAEPSMAIAQEDIFAPVVTLIDVPDTPGVLSAQEQCPYALTASIFGPEPECRALAAQLDTGSIFINDLIFPSTDPRTPFGGRRSSGFGVTQGAEGLLEMTAVKTISAQRTAKPRHYNDYGERGYAFFLAIVRAIYAAKPRDRLRGTIDTIREGRYLR